MAEQTTLQKFQSSVTRFYENEERVNIFTNDPKDDGFYTTNLDPSTQVETLPHLMNRLKNRYLTVFFRGPWQPNTQYSLNDVVQHPDGSFWLVVGPYISGSTIEEDIENRRIIPYGAPLAAVEDNVRWAWTVNTPVAVGGILELPKLYMPGHNSLLLFYLNTVCVPFHAGTSLITGQYQYEEIDEFPGSPSNKVRVWFPIATGEVVDMFVASSQMSEAIEKARAEADRAEEALGRVKGELEDTVARAEELLAEASNLLSTFFLESGVYNVRAAMRVNENIPAGTIITLPTKYYPRRNVLYLSYNGTVCIPFGAGISSGYQYEEIGDDPNEPSDQIKILFDAEPGFIFDLWVVTSALGKNLDAMEALVADAASEADRAGNEADRAETEADRARDVAQHLTDGFDASLIISGTMPLERLPAGALERLIPVTDDDARFALTIDDVQNGDTVQTLHNGLMYRVIDDTQLDNENGYTVYVAGRAAAVDWSGVENKPDTFPPSDHAATHRGGGVDAIDVATQSIAGLMSAEDKEKLDGIEPGAGSDVVRLIHNQTAALAANANFTVPQYIVGSNKLRIWLLGARCYEGTNTTIHQYVEVGTAGAASTTIQFNFALADGDVIMAEVG